MKIELRIRKLRKNWGNEKNQKKENNIVERKKNEENEKDENMQKWRIGMYELRIR